MGSYGRGPNLYDLSRWANILDFEADPNGNQPADQSFESAIQYLAATKAVNGIVYIPVGNFAVNGGSYTRRSHCIEVPNGITLLGEGPLSIVSLRPSSNKTIFANSDPSGGNSNIGFINFRINGNRANNTSGSWNGIDMFNVTDLRIEGLEIDNCRGDGIAIDHCERAVVRDNEIHDNGVRGLFIHFSHRSVINGNRCYNNSVIEAAGDGDGINLSMRSQDNMIALNLCYDLSAFGGDPEGQVTTGKRQGYGIREADNEMVDRNVLVANYVAENLTGRFNQDWGRSIAFGLDQTILGHNQSGNA